MIKHTIIFGEGYEDDRKRHLENCSRIPARRRIKIDVTDYRTIGNEIWNDKHDNDTLIDFFGDKNFYKWFRKVYILEEPSDIEEERFNNENTISKSKG